jgi:hypothetical protein
MRRVGGLIIRSLSEFLFSRCFRTVFFLGVRFIGLSPYRVIFLLPRIFVLLLSRFRAFRAFRARPEISIGPSGDTVFPRG